MHNQAVAMTLTPTAMVLSALLSAGSPLPDFVTLEGNLAFPNEVYLSIIDLPPGTLATPATANKVRAQLLRFLRRAGYELASVETRLVENRIEVKIDEGKLHKVVLRGAGALKTLALKAELTLPHQIFNRFQLERQLDYLAKEYGIVGTSFRLVPVQDTGHVGPQIHDIEALADFQPSGSYQLHVQLGRRRDWETGWKLHMRVSQPDGLSLGTSYWGRSLLFDDDRWRVGAWTAGNLFQPIDNGSVYLATSRATGEAMWATPALAHARAHVLLRGDYHFRQRRDLDIDFYRFLRGEGSLGFTYEFRDGLRLYLGGGVEARQIYSVKPAAGAPPLPPYQPDQRAFWLGGLEIVVDPAEIRLDRRHELFIEGRQYIANDNSRMEVTKLSYQKVFEWGWNDIWVEARGAALWGDIMFPDEEPVGGPYLRGTFGGEFYVHRVGSLSLEFRLSLNQDLLKVSIFHDVAGFEQLDAMREPIRWRIANSTGAGLHALIADVLQLDIYYAVGFSSDGAFDRGVAASLRKAF